MRTQTLIVLLCIASLIAFTEAVSKKKAAHKPSFLQDDSNPFEPDVVKYGSTARKIKSIQEALDVENEPLGDTTFDTLENRERVGSENPNSPPRRRRRNTHGPLGDREGTVNDLISSYNSNGGRAHVIAGDHLYDGDGLNAYNGVEAGTPDYGRPYDSSVPEGRKQKRRARRQRKIM
jgi:hypothetical protein